MPDSNVMWAAFGQQGLPQCTSPVALPGHQQPLSVLVLPLDVHTVKVYFVLRDAISQ